MLDTSLGKSRLPDGALNAIARLMQPLVDSLNASQIKGVTANHITVLGSRQKFLA